MEVEYDTEPQMALEAPADMPAPALAPAAAAVPAPPLPPLPRRRAREAPEEKHEQDEKEIDQWDPLVQQNLAAMRVEQAQRALTAARAEQAAQQAERRARAARIAAEVAPIVADIRRDLVSGIDEELAALDRRALREDIRAEQAAESDGARRSREAMREVGEAAAQVQDPEIAAELRRNLVHAIRAENAHPNDPQLHEAIADELEGMAEGALEEPDDPAHLAEVMAESERQDRNEARIERLADSQYQARMADPNSNAPLPPAPAREGHQGSRPSHLARAQAAHAAAEADAHARLQHANAELRRMRRRRRADPDRPAQLKRDEDEQRPRRRHRVGKDESDSDLPPYDESTQEYRRPFRPRSPEPLTDQGPPDDDDDDDDDQETEGRGVAHGRGMSNFELDHLLQPFGRAYLGAIAHDQVRRLILPHVRPRSKGCFIVNSEPSSSRRMGHWCAVFWNCTPGSNNEIDYFNSFGLPPDRQMRKDLKYVAAKLNANCMIVLKFNHVVLQTNAASTCGWHCAKFIMDMMRGKKFVDATGWNDAQRGEKEIRRFKSQHGGGGQHFPYVPSFGLRHVQKKKHGLRSRRHRQVALSEGAGVLGAVADVGRRLWNKATSALVRVGPSPSVRSFCAEHGNAIITALKVIRNPIQSAIRTISSVLSGGRLNERAAQMHYDEIFHLALNGMLSDGRAFSLQKNAVVEVGPPISKVHSDAVVNLGGKRISFQQFLDNTQNKYGKDRVWKYDATNNNCQNYVTMLLSANGWLTPELDAFINQHAEELVKGSPFFQTIARGATDAGAIVDRLLHGAGARAASLAS